MSQDLRDYDLYRLDERPNEAERMSVTATVGPTGHGDIQDNRGVQITLDTPRTGTVYARVSEPQVRDLIDVLQTRVDSDAGHEATGWETDRKRISKTGDVVGVS